MRTQSCHEGCFFLGPVGSAKGRSGYDDGAALFDPIVDAVEVQILTAGMIKRLFALTMVLGACLALGACASFSGYVADSWPTWAGGMPKDVPPRPGAPGYEEFISHQQGNEAQAPAPAGPAAARARTHAGRGDGSGRQQSRSATASTTRTSARGSERGAGRIVLGRGRRRAPPTKSLRSPLVTKD